MTTPNPGPGYVLIRDFTVPLPMDAEKWTAVGNTHEWLPSRFRGMECPSYLRTHFYRTRAPISAPMTEGGRPAVYVASRTKHAPTWRLMRNVIKIVATWIDEAEEGQTSSYAELSERCLSDIRRADYVLLYCENSEPLKGALIEAGMALALGKPVRCVGGNNETMSRVFRKHPLWSEYPSILQAIEPPEHPSAPAEQREREAQS